MARFLSAEWLDELARVGREHAPFGDVSGRVQVVVGGGPEKDVKFVVDLDGGRISGVAAGVAADAPLTVTLQHPDAVAIEAGELDASVAYMQGRLKAAGDTGLLLQLLLLTRSPAYHAFREKLAAVTEV
ncbi:MAG TPA: SCP2 sterol-binding domain-containing protein [Acidimicrobiia bacterium]|nr:SCP2 sterol-binding domain-containing protein [Acidimicrobiia bacterium]